ncbi:TAXI family TRAP transporter solute-binding subunit [Aureimonas phyllosphaerae]|uniref:TRAP-type uncharacterized transport system substrate-binding protein n=1 Tax=Aureimonas phyllosphaerae TaxID=1166078 RepID=A0A7W6FW16_9HYPH|nr:TAXI family TRAP transporter solute-binding subunit [Aureimonas phyllosphaerae]MBB3937711.1 TRAP-type uncharacterized transport system substrate-binding protein [Aureimonas phyllosphaerae]MBB3961754.1 TRAP-type uncharacterized transport system substrate-binding protein [Aureimonas phyllosphaerae]SFF45336.1 TRAP-type uncharacterized transport system, substrate-binding protein [Aureimonas phyllosphaerae]
MAIRLAAFAAATLMGAAAPALADAPLRVCTASKSGNYFAFAEQLRRTLNGAVVVEPIATEGSWKNLDLLKKGDCDAAVIQSDADTVYRSSNAGAGLAVQRVGAVFKETLNLVCNASLGIDDLGDLISKKPKVAIGKFGSGSWVSWNGLVHADKVEGGDEYSVIPTEPVGDALALTQIVDGSDVGCMFFTSAKNSDFVARIASVAGKGSVLDFVDVVDKDFNDTLDAKGKPLYEPTAVKYEGFGHWGSTDTLSVTALFYVSDAWIAANPDAFDDVVSSFLPVAANLRAARGLD